MTAAADKLPTSRREPVTPDATPWHVVIDGRRRGQPWGRYVSRAGAAATVRDLRAHGFTGVRIIGPDGEFPLDEGAS
jgi:hypothetical protein